jgi:hypothetical protein
MLPFVQNNRNDAPQCEVDIQQNENEKQQELKQSLKCTHRRTTTTNHQLVVVAAQPLVALICVVGPCRTTRLLWQRNRLLLQSPMRRVLVAVLIVIRVMILFNNPLKSTVHKQRNFELLALNVDKK